MEDYDGLEKLKQQAPQPERADPEEKKILKRDIARAAMTRLEESAETDEEFEDVVRNWDRLDRNRERRERYHEMMSPDVLLDLESPVQMNENKRVRKPMRVNHERTIIPIPFMYIWWRHLLSGRNIDLIYNCPIQFHNMTSNHQLYGLLRDLSIKKPYPKEVFFFLAVVLLSTDMLGRMRNQTDRYMRKIYRGVISEIRYELFFYLYCKYKKRLPLTKDEKEYVLTGIDLYKNRREMDWNPNEEDAKDDDETDRKKRKKNRLKVNDGGADENCTVNPDYNQELNKYYDEYCAEPNEADIPDPGIDNGSGAPGDYFKEYGEILAELLAQEEKITGGESGGDGVCDDYYNYYEPADSDSLDSKESEA